MKQRVEIELDTVDEYCRRAGIDHIDVLKSDTQGFDLAVLQGADAMLQRKSVRLIYIEVIFSAMYEGMPRVDETLRFLFDHGFRVVSFYDMHYQTDLLGWTDVLLVQPAYSVEK